MPVDPQDRIRTTKACVACSIRKIKCDGQNPCAHCIRFFGSECFYTTAKKRGPPKGSPARGGHKKRALNQAAAAAAAAQNGQNGTPNGDDKKKENGSGNGTPDEKPPPPALPAPEPRITTPLVQSTTPSLDNNLLTDLGMLSNTASMEFVPPPDVYPRDVPSIAFKPPTPTGSVGSVMSVPASTIGGPSIAGDVGLTSEGLDDLLLVYETFIHPCWPIVYVPALPNLRVLRTQSPLLFDAILAICAANSDLVPGQPFMSPGKSPGSDRPFSTICETLTESVRQRVMCAMMNGTPASLEQVQALIYVALSDLGNGKSSLAYQMSGIACRMAIDLGLNTHFADPSDKNRTKQERIRTIWACFILDKIVAAVQQRPPSLHRIDIDAPRVSTMEREELDLWLSGGAQALLSRQSADAMACLKSHTLSSFNAWADVMALLEQILDEVYRPSTRRARMDGVHVEGYEDAVRDIDAQLKRWRASLPEHLQWRDEDENAHADVGLHLLTCRGWYELCLVLLHRPQVPYLESAESPSAPNDPYRSALVQPPYKLPSGVDVSRAAATQMCKIMESYERTFRIRKFASSWVYLVFQAATVHAGLASEGGVAETVTRGHPRQESHRRLEQCIRWLDQISMQWVSASRHVEILRKLNAVGSRTRPPSPAPMIGGNYDLAELGGEMLPSGASTSATTGTGQETLNDLDLNAWMLLWAGMPTAGDDINLWQQCFPDMPAS